MEALGFLICVFALVAFLSVVFRVAGFALKVALPVLGGAIFLYLALGWAGGL